MPLSVLRNSEQKANLWYPLFVRCTASMIGKDNQLHSVEVDATSLFDAAHQYIRQWSMVWWFDSDALIEVQTGEHRWKVHQAKIREWRTSRKPPK